MKKNQKIAIYILILTAIVIILSALEFVDQWKSDLIVAGNGVTRMAKLSDYYPGLRGEYCDTDIYFLESNEPGGTVFVLGGTHPNEPSVCFLWCC